MFKLYNAKELPKIGLGTFRMTDEDHLIDVIHKALDIGYRHFDTAQMYHNEKAIGRALSNYDIKREELFITTKLQQHHSPNKTRELIMESLKNLQIDYLDLLLIHWPNHDDEINYQTWTVFEDLYNKGILKNIGVSNFTRHQLNELMKRASIKPMVNQIEMHPGLAQLPTKAYLEERKIQLIGYGPFMKGAAFKEPYIDTLKEIAKKYNASVAQIIIAWGLARNIAMIPKTATLSRLSENYNAININLSKDDINTINELSSGKRVYSDPANNVYGNYIK